MDPREQANIFDIPIARITDEYLNYIKLMKKLDIAVAADFLVMAAPLRDFSGKAVGVIELARDHSEVVSALARQSWQMTAIYVFTMSLLQAFGRGAGADFEMAMMLLTPALAYLGLRTLDGWAPYSKTSGHKVQATISSGIGKLLSRAG